MLLLLEAGYQRFQSQVETLQRRSNNPGPYLPDPRLPVRYSRVDDRGYSGLYYFPNIDAAGHPLKIQIRNREVGILAYGDFPHFSGVILRVLEGLTALAAVAFFVGWLLSVRTDRLKDF